MLAAVGRRCGATAWFEELRDEGVESVAVCLLHSYINPEHEQRIGEILADRIAVTLCFHFPQKLHLSFESISAPAQPLSTPLYVP